jgi:hypothetical protein
MAAFPKPRRSASAPRAQPTARLCALGLVLVGLVAVCGCVQRRLTIRSNPPGALVYIDNYEIGTTPCSTDFVYYGMRRVRIVKDGYETLDQKQFIFPPWYEWFPIDFFTENILPAEIRDSRTLEFQLAPQMIVPTDQLIGRAENLRRGSKTENFVPPPQIKQPTGFVAPPWIPNMMGPNSPPPTYVPPTTLPPTYGPPSGALPPPTSVIPAPVPSGPYAPPTGS